MKNLKRLSLVAAFAALFSSNYTYAQVSTNLHTITSTNSGEGGEIQLNDPQVTSIGNTNTAWAMDNYNGSLRFFRNSVSNTQYVDFMGILRIKNSGLSIKTPNIPLTDMSQTNGGLVIEGSGPRSDGSGACLGFSIDPGNGGSAWQSGRIMVTPDKYSTNPVGVAYGKMYLQTRGDLIGGNWTWNKNIVLNSDGAVGINTDYIPADYKLAIDGGFIATFGKVQLRNLWPDYVFRKDYKLRTLTEVENFIATNSHLPDVPSEQELKDNGGIDLGNMDAVLLRKIEELTLYMIQLKKDNEVLKAQLDSLSK